jgi:hypothetical protein
VPAYRVIDETGSNTRTRGLAVSYWLLAVVTGLLPARWLLIKALGRGDSGSSDRVPFMARVFGTVASLSILLAFAMGVAWVKSWYVGDRVSWRDPARPQFVDVHSGKGELVVHFRKVDEGLVHSTPDLASAPNGFNWRQDAEASVGYTLKTFCFEHDHQVTHEGASSAITVAAPYWVLVMVALVLPSWWLRNQKYGPIRVTRFGGPAADARDKPPIRSIHVIQRPL